MNTVRIIRFTWHDFDVAAEDAEAILRAAEFRCARRWRISDFSGRFLEKDPRTCTGILELTWTYGPVNGGRPDDGRKFMERVLHDAFDRPLTVDLRDDYPDVAVLEQSEADQLDFFKPFTGG